MPIGIVSDDDFMGELSSYDSNVRRRKEEIKHEVIDVPSVGSNEVGRKEGDVNIPDSLRSIIGETSVIDGRAEALKLASQFGISPSSVSAYAKGATSTTSYNSPSKSIISHINKSRERHIKKASHVLNSALSAINQEKLDYTDAKDLSSIAKDMSVIIKNLEPQSVPSETEGKTGPQFVIYAPSFRSENSFQSINVIE